MAIATSYRPSVFKDVVGQESAVAVLKAIALAQGVTVRSIILYGSWGSGKSTLARLFGKAVNCHNLKANGDVCNECEGCKEASAKNSQTYLEYDSTRTGSVEAIRGMESIFSSAVRGRRVIVFDEIHAASRAAQTALLKVLEEGVKDTFFVFCTTDKVLDTIKSRSLILDITTLPATLIKDRVRQVAALRDLAIDEKQLDALAVKARGHMRDALSVLEHFELAGDVALKTPINLLKKFVVYSLQRKPVKDLIHEIMLFSVTDIRSSLSVLVKDLYVSENDLEVKLRAKGVHHKVFQFLFSPVAQEAMKDEYGIEILLNSFYERIS